MTPSSAAKSAEVAQEHTIAQSIALHLLPGILVGAFYFASVRPVRNLGFPSVAALILAALVVLVPLELGLLIHEGRRAGGQGIEEIIAYRQRIPWTGYLIWVPIIFVASGLITTLLTPVTDSLETLFTWLPEAYRLDMGLSGAYSKPILVVTYLLFFLTVSLVAPVVEELYFRGYLLPRMPSLRGWAPVLHSALFALYHTWTPWMALSRTLALLPLIYVVRWKKSIYLGIVAHCLLNTIDAVVGLAFILGLS